MNGKDPYSGRPLNMGEIGCFMSHYHIWQEMVEKNVTRALILEDDARFALHFTSDLSAALDRMSGDRIDWELL